MADHASTRQDGARLAWPTNRTGPDPMPHYHHGARPAFVAPFHNTPADHARAAGAAARRDGQDVRNPFDLIAPDLAAVWQAARDDEPDEPATHHHAS